MLKQDQPVTVTAHDLDYDGVRSTATYAGDARLYQGDTSIKGETLVVDDKNGDLSASGAEKAGCHLHDTGPGGQGSAHTARHIDGHGQPLCARMRAGGSRTPAMRT